MWVELCIVSARGLHHHHRHRLWKLHWFAVAWVNPNDKYCTRIDSSGNPSPVWGTKFRALVDPTDDHCLLHVEVYSRDPLFLREKLHGSAQVPLNNGNMARQELCSFQLRSKSYQPKGFVDVSFRTTSMDKHDGIGIGIGIGIDYEGFQLAGGRSNVISLEREAGSVQACGGPSAAAGENNY